MLICGVLLVSTIYDLRFREVPTWLTLSALIASGTYAIFRGLWMPVLLVIALCLISELTIPAQRRSFAIVISAYAAIFEPSTALICLALFAVWTLWDFELMGGADAKLIAVVLLGFGNPIILIPVTLIGGIQGVMAIIRKQKSVPYVLSIFLGTLAFTLFPLIHT